MLGAAVVLSLAGSIGCHARVTRMVKQGRYDAAIERAETRKWEVRGDSARAYAEALVERGRLNDARDVLYRDFRHGQKLESLALLSELELRMGARGVAAVHFARMMQLDATRLEGRQPVCQLFRDRARAYLAQGEPIAADQDLRRVYELCGEPADPVLAQADRELASRIAPLARERARQLRKLERSVEEKPPTRAERLAELESAGAEARAAGWQSLAAWATQEEVVLDPIEVVGILLDEFDDPGRGALYSPEQIESWLGEGLVAPLFGTAALADLDPDQIAYLKLRLAPVAAVRGEKLKGLAEARLEAGNSLAELPAELRAARRWKAAALANEPQAAELVLTSWLKSTIAETPAEALTAGEDSSSVGPDLPLTPWWTRVELSPNMVGPLMTVGRLREARGQSQSALELWRAMAERSGASTQSRIGAAHWVEAQRQLARTEPWRALVLAEALGAARRDAIRAVAETQLAFLATVCVRPSVGCSLTEMRSEAERVMGSAWVRARERSMTAQRPARRHPVEGCALGPELLASDAGTLVSRFLAWRDAGSPAGERAELAERAIRELEADLTLGCSAQIKLEISRALVAEFGLQRLAELLTQSSVERSSSTLRTRSMLALAAGESSRAWEWMRAAAAESPDPAAVYREAARIGRVWRDREFELSARTHLAAIDPGARHGADARALLRVRFEDRFQSQLMEAGWAPALEAWAEDFALHLASIPGPRRWGAGRRLARELWSHAPREAEARTRWITRMEELVGEVAVATIVARPVAVNARHLMSGALADDPMRALVARATLGDEGPRTAAITELAIALQEGAGSRGALVQLFVQGGTALDADGRTTPLLVSGDLSWRIALGLEVDTTYPG